VNPGLGLEEATLTCPSGDQSPIAYWNKWTGSTPRYVSPFAGGGGEKKYVTFEPDEGGFNNIRMGMEIMFVFAVITGRTLVLPDEYPMYLLGEAGETAKRTMQQVTNPSPGLIIMCLCREAA